MTEKEANQAYLGDLLRVAMSSTGSVPYAKRRDNVHDFFYRTKIGCKSIASIAGMQVDYIK
jgi:hypothetical protein